MWLRHEKMKIASLLMRDVRRDLVNLGTVSDDRLIDIIAGHVAQQVEALRLRRIQYRFKSDRGYQ